MNYSVKLDGCACNVILQDNHISLETLNGGNKKKHVQANIQIEDILAVQSNERDGILSLRLSHVMQLKDKRLKVITREVTGPKNVCILVQSEINSRLNAMNRPKRLLVFINPKSGHKKAMKIYNRSVAPLFKLCGIQTTKIVTTRAGQPKQLLSDYDLSLLNGIVSVGGDGMYSECVNGLLARIQGDNSIDINNPEAPICSSKIPIGIIPAGSGNYLVSYMHGTNDVETAALKIVLGDHFMSNVVSVHQGRQLECYSSLVTGFGLIGDMMHDCEKFRWMGPSRYNIIPVSTMGKRRTIDVEVEYIPAEKAKFSPTARDRYLRQCSLPANSRCAENYKRMSSTPGTDKLSKYEWRKLDGRVYGVDTYVVSRKKTGDKLQPCFGDSGLDIWVTEKCSLLKHIEQLKMFEQHKSGCLDFEFIRKLRVYGYRVKLTSARTQTAEEGTRHLMDKYFLNLDGEAIQLKYPEFEVRLHQNAVPIFGKTTRSAVCPRV